MGGCYAKGGAGGNYEISNFKFQMKNEENPPHILNFSFEI